MHPFESNPRASDLIQLDPDHPGFRDPVYRARRNQIAAIALEYAPGTPVPSVAYTAEEEGVWRAIWDRLGPLHEERVCSELLSLQRGFAFAEGPIPQIEAVNRKLAAASGARMEPVAGLIAPRTFLSRMGSRVLLTTQYIRHASRPLYTPEPDLVHEFVGHASTLAEPSIVRVHELLGLAARIADEATMLQLERLYWYTLEFGVVEERGNLRAFGAGLLSSAGELEQFDRGPELLPFDVERMIEMPYDPTSFQPSLFVAPSFGALLSGVCDWLIETVVGRASDLDLHHRSA